MNETFKKILCPVDLSSFSLDALKMAVELAIANDARLDVLHVIHNPFDELYMTAITHADPALFDAYADEPQRRAKIKRITEEHAEILLKQ
jgi:nucleotide-binding universal stress UspA family protein